MSKTEQIRQSGLNIKDRQSSLDWLHSHAYHHSGYLSCLHMRAHSMSCITPMHISAAARGSYMQLVAVAFNTSAV